MTNSLYLSAKELKALIPQMSIGEARKIIAEVREEQEERGDYLIKGKTKLAPTDLVFKKLGIRRK